MSTVKYISHPLYKRGRKGAIIRSITNVEQTKPVVVNGSRKKRIANGSGTSVQEVNNILKQFCNMQKMMKIMNKMGGIKKGLPI